VSAIVVLSIVYALLQGGYPIITNWIFHGFGMNWVPNMASYGAIPLIFLTFYGAIGCTIVATVIGIPTAIYLAEFSDNRLRNIIKPCLEVLTGLPSVVLGLVGMGIIVTSIGVIAGPGTGSGILAVWIVVGAMSLPTVATISEDAIKRVPKDLKEASLGLGATRWQTMTKILIPVAMPGILASILLAMGNAIGETMACYFIVGNANSLNSISFDIVHGTNLIPPIIASGATGDFTYYPPLYALGFILFVIIGVLNLAIRALMKGRGSGAPTKPVRGGPIV
jgi:ABC-type phosphate transport system permease subunit